MYVCVYIYIYICIYIYIYTHVCVYIYIYIWQIVGVAVLFSPFNSLIAVSGTALSLFLWECVFWMSTCSYPPQSNSSRKPDSYCKQNIWLCGCAPLYSGLATRGSLFTLRQRVWNRARDRGAKRVRSICGAWAPPRNPLVHTWHTATCWARERGSQGRGFQHLSNDIVVDQLLKVCNCKQLRDIFLQ